MSVKNERDKSRGQPSHRPAVASNHHCPGGSICATCCIGRNFQRTTRLISNQKTVLVARSRWRLLDCLMKVLRELRSP